MDFMQLQYFKVLAETEHMTRAANALHVAQPALSRSLRTLEEELGLLLFDRMGKHIRLNDNGRVLYRHTEVILGALGDAKMELAERRGEGDRQVSIAMQAGSKLLPDIIRGFKEQHGDIALQIMQQDTGADLDAIIERCDITVYSSIHPADRSNAVTLMCEELCLAMPADNRLSRRNSVELWEVANEPFICLYKGKGLRTVTDEYCRMAGFTPNIVLESDNPATVRDLIAMGVGLAFIPKLTWRGMGSGAGVVLVEIAHPHCTRFVNMAWRNSRFQSQASQALRAYLIDFFRTLAEEGSSEG